ncbi:hypothetical protein TTHERM_01079180 (macronuclear) [Tetrahymena thermophila SB210]|uniref:MyTH4 domain-containing protein n=1 Tax=Tetrahymena thermophila (strain SB210) TaxID=312017 RepID=Q24CD3_TETTS|nr:hypothetical protein TTHERM_01079180 [Tetrahymena thermophila SB210]EAS05441.2 hypothetical protein TTHERM_01079180 [Tetrahymena thermophila SB210]|eukprot:XP_001025686.2 hypothetical protein TTHERM_01079180 [Tetrahymena thermophila SB210]
MQTKQKQNNPWLKPGTRILCIRTAALLSHEKIKDKVVHCCWRIVRFVVTEKEILYYKHQAEYELKTFQDVEDISITSQSLAKDQMDPNQIKTIQLTHESLMKVIDGLKLKVNEPPTEYRFPLLLQHIYDSKDAQQEPGIPTQIAYFESIEDLQQINRAIQLSSAWIKYSQSCKMYHLDLDYEILDWIQESIQFENIHFQVKINQKSQEELELYVDCLGMFLMQSSAIHYLTFSRDYTNDKFILQDKHLLINIKYDQIYSLVFNECNINYNILKNLTDVISANVVLASLNLSQNKLTDECLPLLNKVIENCTNLKVLDLSCNLFLGNRKYFYDFIDLINLLQDKTIAEFEEFGFKLDLQKNQIGDDIVDVVEQLIFRAIRPKVVALDLSFNNISKYNLWRLYKGYLQVIKMNNQVDQTSYGDQSSVDPNTQSNFLQHNNDVNIYLNIFPLPFHQDILQDSIRIFNKMDSDIKRQNFLKIKEDQKLRKIRHIKRQNQEGEQKLENQEQESRNFIQGRTESKQIDISIQRLRFGNKPPPYRKAQIQKIKDYRIIIQKIQKDKFITVEQLLKFCQEIDELEFEFPLQLLEPLQEIVWTRLCESLLIRDHYCVSKLLVIGKLVGLELEFFQKYLEITEERKQSIMKKIERFLNFEDIPESQINEVMHYLIKECIRLDLRGPVVEQLFAIKEKRDEFIKLQVKQGFKPELDLVSQEGSKGDCFLLLKQNEDRKKVPKSIFQISINGNFFSHCTRADYTLFSKLSQKVLIEYDDVLELVLSKYESNYYLDLAYKRLQYLLEDFEDLESDNPFSIFEKIFFEGLQDLKLACARLNIQYANFQSRNIYHQFELQQIKQPIEINSDEVFHPVDTVQYSQQYKFTNFIYLRKFEFYYTQNEISLSNLQPSDMFIHRDEDTFIKPLIQFPVPEAKKDLETAMTYLVYCLVVYSRESNSYQKIAPQLQKLISLLNKSKFIPHLKDEVYLQIIKYSTSPMLNDYTEYNLIAIITILTIYCPPSYELNHFIRNFLFVYYGRQRFARLAQDALIHLQNAVIQEIVIPDWVPSLFELEQRIRGYTKFIFKICYPNQSSQEFSLDPFITAGQLMKIVYQEGTYFLKNSITDKYNYWIYQSSIYDKEEIAIMFEDIIIEIMSQWDQNPTKFASYSLLVKRRIYQPFHTIRLGDIHQLQINCLFDEQLRYFYTNELYAKSIVIPSLIRIAAYYLAYLTKGTQKGKIDLNQTFNNLEHLIPSSIKYKKDEFALVISRMIEIEKIDKIDKYTLIFNILAQLRLNNFYASSFFTAKLNESELEQVYVVVNAFCINVFSKKNQLKPLHSIYFEEIIYLVATSNNMAKIQTFSKESKTFSVLSIKFDYPRAHEFVQDVISYAYLRIQDDCYALYAYSELFKLRYRHSLLVIPQEIGLIETTDPYTLEINKNLNHIELAETREKVQEIYQHIYSTQFIISEMNDYPFFKETTQYNLQFKEREMRRSSYQESQLQQWFNSVLKERQQMQEEIQNKQQVQIDQQKARRDRVSNHDSQVSSGVAANQNNQNVLSPKVENSQSPQIQQNSPFNQNLKSQGFTNKQEQFAQNSDQDFEPTNNIPNQNNQQQQFSQGTAESTQQKQSTYQSQQVQQNYKKDSMPTIQEADNSNVNSVTMNQEKQQKLPEFNVSNSNNPNNLPSQNQLHKANSESYQQNSSQNNNGSNNQIKEPQSAALPNKKSQNEITNKKLNNKINNALSIKPGAPKSQADLTSPKVVADNVEKNKSQPTQNNNANQQNQQSNQQQQQQQQQQSQSNSQKNNQVEPQKNQKQNQSESNENKGEISASQIAQQMQKNSMEASEDNTLLRHSRQSSREGIKSTSPAQNKERLKSLTRKSTAVHAQNRRSIKKSSNQSSKDNLVEQGQQASNNEVPSSQNATQENEQQQSSTNIAIKKPPMFLKKN